VTSKGRLSTVLVIAMVVAIGAVVALREQHDDGLQKEAAPVADASVDARATAAKAAKPAKKKGARGGKTTITGRAKGGVSGGGGAHAAGGAAHAPGGGAHARGGTQAGSGGKSVHGGDEPSGTDERTEPGGDPGGGGSVVAPRGAHRRYAPPSGPTYESVLDSNDQHVTIGAHGQPDLTGGQLSAPLSDGSFVSDCGAPDSMGVTVKVAIKSGHAVGVSVSTNPASSDVAGCIDHHVRKLSWPSNPKMDSLVTTY